jgi:hypothetical protein
MIRNDYIFFLGTVPLEPSLTWTKIDLSCLLYVSVSLKHCCESVNRYFFWLSLRIWFRRAVNPSYGSGSSSYLNIFAFLEGRCNSYRPILFYSWLLL